MGKNLFKTLFFVGIFVLFLHPIDSDGDFFQHVNIGRYVLEHDSLPITDDLTHTAKGKPYIGYSWGTGIIFYLLYKNFGPIGVNLFVSAIAALTFWLLFQLLKIIAKSEKISFLTIALAAPVIATRFPSRPEIITYPFVVTLMLINQTRAKYPRLSLLFPIIILLWANMYSVSLLVGLVLLNILTIIHCIQDKRHFLNQQKLFYLSILVCLPIAFLNGYGASAIFYILQVPKATQFHGDWTGIFKVLQSAPQGDLLTFQYRILIYLLYLLFFLAILLLVRKIKTYPLFAVLSFALIAPFFALRQVPLVIFLSMPFLALLLSQLGRLRKLTIGFGILISSISLFILIRNDPPKFGEDLQTFPPSMISFIKQNQISGNVFNTQRIGSFLSYHLYPQIKVFADTRDDLFIRTNILQQMGKIIHSGQRMSPYLDLYRVDLVIVDLSEESSYPFLLKDGWVVVYRDSLYLILVPKESAKEKGLEVVKWM